MPKKEKETKKINKSKEQSESQSKATDSKKKQKNQQRVKEKAKRKKILQQAAAISPEVRDLLLTDKVLLNKARLKPSRSYTHNSGLSISDPIEIEDDEDELFSTSDEIKSPSTTGIVNIASDEEDNMEDDEDELFNTSDEIKSPSITRRVSIASDEEDNMEEDEEQYDNEGHYSLIDKLIEDGLVTVQGYGADKENQNDQADASSKQWTENDVILVRKRKHIAKKLQGILKDLNDNNKSEKLVEQTRSHQAGVYAPEQKEHVPVNTDMPKERLLVRHLATTLLAYNPQGMVEVQAAIDHRNEKIYIASNKNEKKLTNLLESLLPGNNKQLSNLNIPTSLDQLVENEIFTETEKQILELGPSGNKNKLKELKRKLYRELKPETNEQTYNKAIVKARLHQIERIWRHMEQLRQEKNGVFSTFTIEQVFGPNEQHAETKIIGKKGTDCIDYIGGTRRPCACCFIYMTLKGLSQEAYNPHNGALWNSIGAWMSLAGFNINNEKEVLELVDKISDKHFMNQGAEGKEIYEVDTQSQEYKFA